MSTRRHCLAWSLAVAGLMLWAGACDTAPTQTVDPTVPTTQQPSDTPTTQQPTTPPTNQPDDSSNTSDGNNNETPDNSPPKTTAKLQQATNGPSVLPTLPTWTSGQINQFQSHFMEGDSIPYRIAMENLPTDGTEVELIINYDIKHDGKFAIGYFTHFQRMESHATSQGQAAAVVNPIHDMAGVPAFADTIPFPAPRSYINVDCLPGNHAQPTRSFNSLSAGERVMSLFGGDFNDITFEGEAPDLFNDTATERLKVTFIPTSKTAVLTWGGYIASQDEFGCNVNDVRSARGMAGSPYVVQLESWSLNEAEIVDSMSNLAGQSVIDPDLYCFIEGPMEVCPNETETTFSIDVEGECEDPIFIEWTVLGDAEIEGDNDEQTVRVTAETEGTYLVFATAFCADCTSCVPLFCCKLVKIGETPTADAGDDQESCPALDGETCFELSGSGTEGTPSWTVISQLTNDPSCNITVTSSDTYGPTVCFPEGCSGSATVQLSVTNECGTATDEVVVTVNPRSTADAGPDDSACPILNTPTCFTLFGSGTNGSPTWSIVDAPSMDGVTITTPNAYETLVCFEAGLTGSATLRLTVSGDPACPASDEVTLTVVEAPTVEAGDEQSVCIADSGATCIDLAGSGTNGTPSWSVVVQPLGCDVDLTNGETYTPTVCFPEDCFGFATLELTVTGADECLPVTDIVTIFVVPAPSADAGPDQDACPALDGGLTCFDLMGSGDNGFPMWTVVSEPQPGSVTIANPDTYDAVACFDPGVNGTATLQLTVSGAEECDDATDQVTLTVGPSDLACTIDPPAMAEIVTGTITGGVAPYTCMAEFNTDGWIVTDCFVDGGLFEIGYMRTDGICTPIPAITVTIIDDEGCATECIVEIPCPQGCTVPSKIACDCPNNPISVCAMPSSGLPPYDFDWSGPMGDIDDMMCLMIDEPGIYVSTVSDGNGLSETCCSAVIDSMISGPSPCPLETGLVYEVNFEIPGGAFTPISYDWSISGNGTIAGLNDQSFVEVDAGDMGVFTLVVEVSGIVTFDCEGSEQTVPVTGTCALAYVVEDMNCGGGD